MYYLRNVGYDEGGAAPMNKLTEYLDIPPTKALTQSFAVKLERLAVIAKLDVAQAILTGLLVCLGDGHFLDDQGALP
jgi:hypothetical protein